MIFMIPNVGIITCNSEENSKVIGSLKAEISLSLFSGFILNIDTHTEGALYKQ